MSTEVIFKLQSEDESGAAFFSEDAVDEDTEHWILFMPAAYRKNYSGNTITIDVRNEID